MSIEKQEPIPNLGPEKITFTNLEAIVEQIYLEWGGGAVINNSELFYTTPHTRRVEILQDLLNDNFEIDVAERTSEDGLQVYDIKVTEK